MSFDLTFVRVPRSRFGRPSVLASAFVAWLALPSASAAQASLDWSATQSDAGSDEMGRVAAVGPDGSVYVATQVRGAPILTNPNFDARLTKFTATGALAWSIEWDTYGWSDTVTAMLATPSGELYVAGSDKRVTPAGFGNLDATLRKFTPDGTQLWFAAIPGFGGIALEFNKLALLSNGAVVGVGSKKWSTLIARFSNSGALEWQHSIGGGFGANVLLDVEVLAGDELLACGRKGTLFNGALALYKYDAAGAHLWTSILDESVEQTSLGLALALTPAGRAVVVGERAIGASQEMAIAQFDAQSGALDWSRYHDAGGAPQEELRDVAVAADGVIWGLGSRFDPLSLTDTVLLRVSATGAVLSSTLWPDGQTRSDQPQALHQGSAGQVWGVVVSGAPSRDIALLQFDSLGALSSQTVVDLGADEIGSVSVLAPGGGLIVAGATNASGDYDVLALRFDLSDAPTGYCTAKVNSLGCTAQLAFVGASSAGATSGFSVLCSNVRNQKAGMLVYSVDGAAATPFQGGYLCVGAPRRRSVVVVSGGSALGDNCSGSFALDLNAFAAGQLGGSPAPELRTAGADVHCQQWSRDPGAASGSGLSAGLRYVVGP